jgi:hypothetical protein
MREKPKPKYYVNKRDHERYALTIGEKIGADGPEKVYQLRNEFHYHEVDEKEFATEFLKL